MTLKKCRPAWVSNGIDNKNGHSGVDAGEKRSHFRRSKPEPNSQFGSAQNRQGNLETAVEFLPRPTMGALFGSCFFERR